MQAWQGINGGATNNVQASQMTTGMSNAGNMRPDTKAQQFDDIEWPQSLYQQATFSPLDTTGHYPVTTSDVKDPPTSPKVVDFNDGVIDLETGWPQLIPDEPQPTLVQNSSVSNLTSRSSNDIDIADELCEIIQIDSDDEAPAPSYPPDPSPPASSYPPDPSPPASSCPPDSSPPASSYPPDPSPPAFSYPPDQIRPPNPIQSIHNVSRNEIQSGVTGSNRVVVATSRDIHGNTITYEKQFIPKPVSHTAINNIQPCFQQQKIQKQRYFYGNQALNQIKLEDRGKWEEQMKKFIQTNQIQRQENLRESTSKISGPAGPMYITRPILQIPEQHHQINKENCRPIDENSRKIIVPGPSREPIPRKVEVQDVHLPVIYVNELKQCANKMGAENNAGMFVYVADKYGNFQKQPLLNTHLGDPPTKMVCLSERKENVTYNNVGTQFYDVEKQAMMRKKPIQLKAIGQNGTQIFYTHELRKKENVNANISLPIRVPLHDSVKGAGNMAMNKVTGRGIVQTVYVNGQQRKRENEMCDTSTIIFDPEHCVKTPITSNQEIKVVYVSEQHDEKTDNDVQFLYGVDKSGRMCSSEVMVPKCVIGPVEKKAKPNGDFHVVIHRPATEFPSGSQNNMQKTTVIKHGYERQLTAEDFNMDESILREDPELRAELQTFQRNLRNSLY